MTFFHGSGFRSFFCRLTLPFVGPAIIEGLTAEQKRLRSAVAHKSRDGRRVKQRVLLKSPWGRFEPCGQDIDHVYRGGE